MKSFKIISALTIVTLLILSAYFYMSSFVCCAPEELDSNSSFLAVSDTSYIDDTATLQKWLLEAKESQLDHLESAILFFAQKQLGIPYVGGLLEVPPLETMVFTLSGSDCVLFVEHTLAMATQSLTGVASKEGVVQRVANLRYYNGQISDYTSRKHYFSEWLRDNAEAGSIEILFQNEAHPPLGPLHFMTSNRSSYRQLLASDSVYAVIKQREETLNSLPPLTYIPQDKIPSFEKQVKTGDIISFVSTIDGLDIAHTAIAFSDSATGKLRFYHASTTGSVILDPKTVFEYTRDRRNVKGVIFARLKSNTN